MICQRIIVRNATIIQVVEMFCSKKRQIPWTCMIIFGYEGNIRSLTNLGGRLEQGWIADGSLIHFYAVPLPECYIRNRVKG